MINALLDKLPTRKLKRLYLAYVDANRARHLWYADKCKGKVRSQEELSALRADKKAASLELRQALAAHRSGLTIKWGDSNQVVGFRTKSEQRTYLRERAEQRAQAKAWELQREISWAIARQIEQGSQLRA